MARKIRDQIKDKRKAILNTYDRVDEHLFAIQSMADIGSEPTTTIVNNALVVNEYARQGMKEILSNL